MPTDMTVLSTLHLVCKNVGLVDSMIAVYENALSKQVELVFLVVSRESETTRNKTSQPHNNTAQGR